MIEPVAFLRRMAEEFRALALSAPEIASELRGLAAWIDDEADRLGGVPNTSSSTSGVRYRDA